MPCVCASSLASVVESQGAVGVGEPPRLVALHSFEHDCPLCEALHVGVFAYREIAEELGSDAPAVLDPIWRERCQARVDAYNDALRRAHEMQAQSDRPVPSLFACVVEPSRRAA
jgi:hypothetical protein